MERRELERQIVEKEWLMFQQVQGVNGRAACQDDWTTFLIMRLSQFEGWDTDVLESYFEDIVQAEAQERNLIMEKYAYMMEETDPVYFLSIKEMLEEGCAAIDLCGAFGNEGVARISKAVDRQIPVGAVHFDFHPAFRDKSGDDLFQKDFWCIGL